MRVKSTSKHRLRGAHVHHPIWLARPAVTWPGQPLDGVVNGLKRHGPNQVGQPPIVIEVEVEGLRGLQEDRDTGVGLEQTRHRVY
jgi:hypothetical protein